MSIWNSAYIDSNRFAIFTDLLQLVPILSQISTQDWQQADSALSPPWCANVALKTATDCEWLQTWSSSLKQHFKGNRFQVHSRHILKPRFSLVWVSHQGWGQGLKILHLLNTFRQKMIWGGWMICKTTLAESRIKIWMNGCEIRE